MRTAGQVQWSGTAGEPGAATATGGGRVFSHHNGYCHCVNVCFIECHAGDKHDSSKRPASGLAGHCVGVAHDTLGVEDAI